MSPEITGHDAKRFVNKVGIDKGVWTYWPPHTPLSMHTVRKKMLARFLAVSKRIGGQCSSHITAVVRWYMWSRSEAMAGVCDVLMSNAESRSQTGTQGRRSHRCASCTFIQPWVTCREGIDQWDKESGGRCFATCGKKSRAETQVWEIGRPKWQAVCIRPHVHVMMSYVWRGYPKGFPKPTN